MPERTTDRQFASTFEWRREQRGASFILCFVLAALVAGIEVSGQTKDTVIVPGGHYAAGGFHRFLFGDLWRDLWTTPITVPILDLDTYAGGLTPTQRGGGFQTQSLRLMGADGIEYKFRSLDKDPSKILDPELRESLIDDIVQDLISTSNPVAGLVAAPILNAVGVLNAAPVLVVLPDDERLGEFRDEFGGLLGTLEVHPDEGDEETEAFAGADKVAGTYKLFARLEEDSDERVHSVAFLKARLMDVYLGDWDRHVDQWRWAGYDSAGRRYWKPIPRDRDQAFCRYDGIIPNLAERAVPQIEGCDESYPDINDLTWSGRHLDRKFLTGVSRSEWDSVTAFILSRLTDSLLEYSVRRLPPEMYAREGTNLLRLLKKRRDGLPAASQTYYRQIAKYPDVSASDGNEVARIERVDDERVRVTLYKVSKETGAPKNRPFFDRTFHRDETKDIRLYMLGGDDRIVLTGNVESSIQIRIVGGDGADELIDSSKVAGDFLSIVPFIPDAENKTLFYDDGKKTTVREGPGTTWDRSRYREPSNDTLRWEPVVRDYGHDWKAITWLGYNPDEGLFIGGGPALTEYGFRADPFVFRQSVAVGFASSNGTFKAQYNGEFHKWIDGARVTLHGLGSQFELLNFFGFGNESVRDEKRAAREYYEIEQTQLLGRAAIEFPLFSHAEFGIGGRVKYTTTELDESRVLDSLRPYGVEDLGLFNLHASATYDSRDNRSAPTKGVYLSAEGRFFPELLDNRETFQTGEIEGRVYLTANVPMKTTLALRAVGRKNWGVHPYFESVFLGGSRSIRGFEENRFAGDAALWGNAELRLDLFKYKVLIPGSIGVMGLADAGRVWLKGEDSDTWHTAYGGGLTVSFVEPRNVLVLSLVNSGEKKLAFYAGFGFAF